MPPAAGFNVYAGTSGRVRAGRVTPDLTVDLVTSAAYAAVTPVTQSWTGEWTITDRIESGKLMTFESTATAEGVIRPRSLRGGIGNPTGKIKGAYDTDSSGNVSVRFPIGAFCVVDLVMSKAANFGFAAVKIKILQPATGASMRPNPNEFEFDFEVDGDLPTPAYF